MPSSLSVYSAAVQTSFFRQSVSISAAPEESGKATAHFTLDCERKRRGAEMPVFNYVDLCAWCWSITLLVFSPKCLESTKDSFVHF